MRVSQFTIDRLKSITADELISHGVIKPAPNQRGNSGYVCLFCGSGEGGNHANGIGDGAGTFDAENKFYCHACQNSANGGHKLSPIDLFAISRNLQSENFGEICRQMCDEFGLPCEFENGDDLPRPSRPTTAKKKITESIAPKEKISEDEMLIREDLSVSDDELINFVRYGCGGKWRGLTVETLQKFGCKYKFKWTSPKSRAAKKYSTPTPRVLIPCDNLRGYIARLVAPIDSFDEQTRKYISPKEHAGRKALFNGAALNSNEPIFAVEGAIDAMTAEQCGFRAVAINGVGNGDLLVKAVTKLAQKPKIIILLDSDEHGRKHAPKLRADLLRVGAPCCVRFLSDDESKIDANEILTTKGDDALKAILQSIVDDSTAELDDVEKEIAAAQVDDALNSDHAITADLNFLFQGDASDLDFARRFEFAFGDKVRWLKDDERWLTYGNGVWTFGSDKNSAVAPFARKVADAMIRHAATKFEVKLAGALKSAAKISAAVTMMKSLDSILVTSDDLDNHPELLNCKNGVVDLQTGKLYPHDSSLLLTQQVNAAYDTNATSELVDNFFKSIQPNEMTRAGLLRWLGYCLSGEVNEEKFLVWQGGGSNGKGVLSHTILELFGSYGVGLTPTALLKNNRPADANAATTSLNSLEKARFAISEELPLKAELDASLIKNLSGGDRINLRRNYGEYRTIRPTAKINLSGNYLPKIENVNDDGLLRRLLNFSFDVQFGTAENPADKTLKRKMLLPENLNALLSLLVRESVAWYRDGLIISDAMKMATERHLAQNDFVADFIEENFVRAQNAFVKAKNFIDELKNAYPSETSRFGRADLIRLIERVDGVTYCVGTGNVRIFRGIGRLAQSDFDGELVNPSETAMP